MGLPDIDGLRALSPETWRALGRRLVAIGLDTATVSPFAEKAQGDRLHSPVVKWHLRRLEEPSAYAMRMFMFWDAVTEDEARAALGQGLALEPLVEAGLLRRTDEGGIVSPFEMKTADAGNLHILCDDARLGGDAVMGPSLATLALSSFAKPLVRTASAVDVGCGAGTIALTIGPMCDRVVAIDVNPRAIALARVNALLNGIDNVEFCLGDLFDPIGDRMFDLVVSQPPFIPRPPDVPPTTFLFGGDRGDEIAARLLRDTPLHLARGGLAAFMVVWPIVEGDAPLEQRLRETLGPSTDVNLLVVQTVPTDESSINATCTAYAGVRNRSSRESYARDVLRFREHFEQLKIRNLVDTYTFLRRGTKDDSGWTATVDTKELGGSSATRASVEMLLAAGDRILRRAPAAPPPRMISLDLKATVPVQTALSMAEYLAATGRVDQALPLFRDIRDKHATWRPALLGSARVEIACGHMDGWQARLEPVAQLGDREARRLLGDIHWKRGALDAAFEQYAIESRVPAVARPSGVAGPMENRVEMKRSAAPARPFLVWITCDHFTGSVASGGMQLDRPRLWDVALNSFSGSGEVADDLVTHVVHGGLSKLASVKATAVAHPGFFDGYRAVLLLDDDIGIRHEDIERFFWLMARYQLDLAHPSLSDASTGTCFPMFHQRESVMRFTNTVDLRAPAFSRAGLTRCIDSFDQSISGDGLGAVWASLLENRPHAIGVVDAVTVDHLRPIDALAGPFYRHLRALGIDSAQEMHEVHARYGCSFLFPRTLGDVSASGHERHYPE